jgi:hypothetical protein
MLEEINTKIQEMHELLDVPGTFLVGLFTDWLDLASLLALDSACCNAASRRTYLDVVGSSVFCLRNSPYPCVLRTSGMRWFVARKVKVAKLWIECTPDIDVAVTTAFLHITGASLKTFWMSDCPDITTSTALLGLLSLSARRLEALLLDSCDIIDCTVLGVLLSSCAKSLRCLRLSACSLTATLSITMLPGLHKIELDACSTEVGTLCKLISASPSLRSFYCNNLYGSDACLDALAVHCPLLQILHYEKGDPTSVTSLTKLLQCCPDVEVVDIGCGESEVNSSATDAHTAAIMRHCKKLKAFCTPLGTALPTQELLARVPDLVHLCLYDLDFLANPALAALAENCGNLKSLELWALTKESSQPALVRLVSSLKNVEELHLCDCDLTDAVLEAIAEHCLKLEVLHLFFCDQYTEVGIAAVAHRCTALRKVSTIANDAVINPLSRLLWKTIRPGLEFVDEAIGGEFWVSLRDIEREELLSY